ncbi:MAG: hypothetical protein Q4F01_03720 [Staphylococcus rostri]|uniref:hypothetical protein n=1 Tax=Staphylococcus rostri TaxID=522262 RepID=UPI0026E0EEAB|nr:hypothetical protein [Staphylococcus rostri]MDO5375273.1 hypothetical protein [Staphylococcus rostri]
MIHAKDKEMYACQPEMLKSAIQKVLQQATTQLYFTDYYTYVYREKKSIYQKVSFIEQLDFEVILIILNEKYEPLLIWQPIICRLEVSWYEEPFEPSNRKVLPLIEVEETNRPQFDVIEYGVDATVKWIETHISSLNSFYDNTIEPIIAHYSIQAVLIPKEKELDEELNVLGIPYIETTSGFLITEPLSVSQVLELIYTSIIAGNYLYSCYCFVECDVETLIKKACNPTICIEDEALFVVLFEQHETYFINI